MKKKYMLPRITNVVVMPNEDLAQMGLKASAGWNQEEAEVREEVGFLENDGVMGKPYNVWDEEW